MSVCTCFATEHQARLPGKQGRPYILCKGLSLGMDIGAHTDIKELKKFMRIFCKDDFWEIALQSVPSFILIALLQC